MLSRDGAAVCLVMVFNRLAIMLLKVKLRFLQAWGPIHHLFHTYCLVYSCFVD